MKRLIGFTSGLIALGLVSLSCGGGSSSIPQADACNQAAKAACTKIFGCQSLTFSLVQGELVSETMCETTVVQNCGATGFQCGAGQTYHGDQAQMCKDQFNGQACATLDAEIVASVGGGISSAAIIASLTTSLPGCNAICTGGTDAGGN